MKALFILCRCILIRSSLVENIKEENNLFCVYNYPKNIQLFDKNILLYFYFRNYLDYNYDNICSFVDDEITTQKFEKNKFIEKETIFLYKIYKTLLINMKIINVPTNLISYLEHNLLENEQKILDASTRMNIKIYYNKFADILNPNNKKIEKGTGDYFKIRDDVYNLYFSVFKEYIFIFKDDCFFDQTLFFFTIYFFEVERSCSQNIFTNIDFQEFKEKQQDLINYMKLSLDGLSKKNLIFHLRFIQKSINENNEKNIFINLYLNFSVYAYLQVTKKMLVYEKFKNYTLKMKLDKITEHLFQNQDLNHLKKELKNFEKENMLFKNVIQLNIFECFSKHLFLQLLAKYLLEKRIFVEFGVIRNFIETVSELVNIEYNSYQSFMKTLFKEKIRIKIFMKNEKRFGEGSIEILNFKENKNHRKMSYNKKIKKHLQNEKEINIRDFSSKKIYLDQISYIDYSYRHRNGYSIRSATKTYNISEEAE